MSGIQDAIRYTEAEILAEAMGDHDFDEGNPAYVDMPGGDGADDHEQTEGLDGAPLSNEEQFATTTGDVPYGYLGDRPLEFMREQELAAELQNARQVNEQLNTDLTKWILEPLRVQERQKLRDELLDAALDHTDGGGADRIIDGQFATRQHAGQLQNNRAEAALQAAHDRYGDSFIDAMQNIKAMDPNDPLACSIVQRAMSSEDPGEAMMRFGSSDMVQSLRARQPPPFMAGGRVAVPRGRGGLDNLDDLERASNMAMGSEQDIFDSAMSDSRDNPYWENL
jgi:hypothetical protein